MNATQSIESGDGEAAAEEAGTLLFRVFGIALGSTVVALNGVFAVTMKRLTKRNSTMRDSTRLLCLSSSSAALLAGAMLTCYSAALPYLPDVHSSVTTPCHLAASLHLSLVLVDSLHFGLLSVDHNYVITSVGCSASLPRFGAAVLGIWLYALFVAFMALVFDLLDYDRPLTCSSCDILDLDPYFCLLVAIQVAVGAVCSAVVFANMRRILHLHQRQIQVTNTLTYASLLLDIGLATVPLNCHVTLVTSWLPLVVTRAMTSAGSITVRLTFLVGHVSYLKLIFYVIREEEVRSEFLRVISWRRRQQTQQEDNRSGQRRQP